MGQVKDIVLPNNIKKWLSEHDGVNVAVNYNNASADYGYAHCLWRTVIISALTRTCNRCGYDPLWNPDDSESRCIRHTYNAWRYDTIFAFSDQYCDLSLEAAFDDWKQSQPASQFSATVNKSYGRFGWK